MLASTTLRSKTLDFPEDVCQILIECYPNNSITDKFLRDSDHEIHQSLATKVIEVLSDAY